MRPPKVLAALADRRAPWFPRSSQTGSCGAPASAGPVAALRPTLPTQRQSRRCIRHAAMLQAPANMRAMFGRAGRKVRHVPAEARPPALKRARSKSGGPPAGRSLRGWRSPGAVPAAGLRARPAARRHRAREAAEPRGAGRAAGAGGAQRHAGAVAAPPRPAGVAAVSRTRAAGGRPRVAGGRRRTLADCEGGNDGAETLRQRLGPPGE